MSDTGFDPDALVAAAVKQVKSKAYRSGQTDWPALEARVRAAAQGARDPVDLLHAYHVLLQGLGDKHSDVACSPA